MRDYEKEFENRVAFIRELVSKSGMKGIVYGNSGGKDSALVGILCKAACDNTVGIIMPCTSKRNYGMDTADAMTVAERYGIETRRVDLSPVKEAAVGQRSQRRSSVLWRVRVTAARRMSATSPSGATVRTTSTPSPI